MSSNLWQDKCKAELIFSMIFNQINWVFKVKKKHIRRSKITIYVHICNNQFYNPKLNYEEKKQNKYTHKDTLKLNKMHIHIYVHL